LNTKQISFCDKKGYKILNQAYVVDKQSITSRNVKEKQLMIIISKIVLFYMAWYSKIQHENLLFYLLFRIIM
jgi:hypothetical protein